MNGNDDHHGSPDNKGMNGDIDGDGCVTRSGNGTNHRDTSKWRRLGNSTGATIAEPQDSNEKDVDHEEFDHEEFELFKLEELENDLTIIECLNNDGSRNEAVASSNARGLSCGTLATTTTLVVVVAGQQQVACMTAVTVAPTNLGNQGSNHNDHKAKRSKVSQTTVQAVVAPCVRRPVFKYSPMDVLLGNENHFGTKEWITALSVISNNKVAYPKWDAKIVGIMNKMLAKIGINIFLLFLITKLACAVILSMMVLGLRPPMRKLLQQPCTNSTFAGVEDSKQTLW